LIVTLITFAFCEKEGIVGVIGLEVGGVSIVDGVTDLDTAGVVERDTLEEGIARGIFEAVPVLEAVADDDELPLLNLGHRYYTFVLRYCRHSEIHDDGYCTDIRTD
jgi:hypothetical protein